MGLILFAVLILLGARGMSLRKAMAFCVVTAAILTLLGISIIIPGCDGLRCVLPALGATFAATLAIAFGCFGIGIAARRVLVRPGH